MPCGGRHAIYGRADPDRDSFKPFIPKALCTPFTIITYRGFMRADTTSLDVYKMRFPSRWEKLLQRGGLSNGRNLLWSWYEPRNFGDWIGPYLFAKMTGRLPLHCKPRPGQRSLAQSTAGVGSILRHIQVADRVAVWGSGIISCTDRFARPRRVLAVRGPRTRARLAELDYPLTDVFGDPGLLMPLFYTPSVRQDRAELGIIPHYLHLDAVRAQFADRPEIRVIDVTGHIEQVIDDIAACRHVLSSSLHGLIMADAYGIPCRWMATQASAHGDDIKYIDYLESLGVFDITGPVAIVGDMPLDDLVALAACRPVPETRRLAQELLQVCPFRR